MTLALDIIAGTATACVIWGMALLTVDTFYPRAKHRKGSHHRKVASRKPLDWEQEGWA